MSLNLELTFNSATLRVKCSHFIRQLTQWMMIGLGHVMSEDGQKSRELSSPYTIGRVSCLMKCEGFARNVAVVKREFQF